MKLFFFIICEIFILYKPSTAENKVTSKKKTNKTLVVIVCYLWLTYHYVYVFGLLVGIYIADIVIDILIFISPTLTSKLVQSSVLSFFATIAFLYLAYKSFFEAFDILHSHYQIRGNQILIDICMFIVFVVLIDILVAKVQKRERYLSRFTNLRLPDKND